MDVVFKHWPTTASLIVNESLSVLSPCSDVVSCFALDSSCRIMSVLSRHFQLIFRPNRLYFYFLICILTSSAIGMNGFGSPHCLHSFVFMRLFCRRRIKTRRNSSSSLLSRGRVRRPTNERCSRKSSESEWKCTRKKSFDVKTHQARLRRLRNIVIEDESNSNWTWSGISYETSNVRRGRRTCRTIDGETICRSLG